MFGSVEQAFDLGAAGVGRHDLLRLRRVDPPDPGGQRGVRRRPTSSGMFTVLWCYLRNTRVQEGRRRLPRRRRPHRPGQPPRRHHRGRHHQAEAAREQRRLQRARGLRQDQQARLRRAHHRPPDRPLPLAGGQLLHGPHRAHQQRRRVEGRERPRRGGAHRGHQQAGRRHRASSAGRKAFQRPMAEGVELLNAIQDVYLDDVDHHRLTARAARCAASHDRAVTAVGDGVRPASVSDEPRYGHRLGRQVNGTKGDAVVRHRAARHERTEVVDRVIIRFAGDSGDGMQLTGDRFTSASALFGNDLATLPDFPAEIRAPAGHAGRRLGLPGPHLRPRHHDAGRRAQRARGHEPGRAAQPSSARLEPGGTLIVNADAFDERNLTKAGYAANPLDDGSLDGYTVYEVPMTSLTKEAVRAARREAPRRRAVEELLRPRPRLVDVHPAGRARRSTGSSAASWPTPQVARRQHRPRSRPATPSARRPSCSTTPTRSSRPTLRAGHLHQHQRQHRAGLGPRRRRPAGRAAAVPRVVPDHAGVRHPPRAVEAQELRRAHPAGRGRDRRHRRRARRGLRRAPRRHHHQRPGHGAQGRDHGPGGQPRAAAAHHRHPARRPSTGLPTKTEQADLLHGDVRPPRRGAAADRGRPQPVATASRWPSRRPASRSSTARR